MKKQMDGCSSIDSTPQVKSESLSLPKCNVIKVFMMLAVILYHSMAFWMKGGWFNCTPATPSPAFDFLATWLNTIHIYVFTFVSGYIFYYLKYEIKKYDNTGRDFAKRAKRLLIPYAFISLCWAIPFQIFYFGFDIKQIIMKYVLAVSPSQLWFLWMLFILFVLFYLVSDFMNKLHFAPGVLICLGMYAVSIIGNMLTPNFYQIWTACKYLIFYYFGFSMRKYGFSSLYKIPWLVYFIANALLFSAFYFFFRDSNSTLIKIVSQGLSVLCQISGVIMIVIGFGKLKLEKIQNSVVFKFLYKYNFGIYLFHQQLIYISISLWNGNAPTIVIMISNFIFSCIVSVLISMALEKCKTTKKLIGI